MNNKSPISGGYSSGTSGGGGGGTGTVTDISSPNNTILVANPTTSPDIDVNVGTSVGQIPQLQNLPDKGASLPDIYTGNTKVTNAVTNTIASIDDTVVALNNKIPSTVVQNLNGLSGGVSLVAGSNTTITPSGSTLVIANTLATGVIPLIAVWDYNRTIVSMSYSNNVFTATANGTLPQIDQVTLAVNARLVLINYTSAAYNGIYVVTSMGSGSTKFVLTRASDFNTIDNMKTGIFFPVNNSLTKSGQGMYGGSIVTLAFPVTTVGTSSVYFSVLTPFSTNPIGWVIAPNLDNKYLSSNQDVTKLANGTVNNTKFQYLSNVTSDVQTQIDSKLSSVSGFPAGTLNQTISADTNMPSPIPHYMNINSTVDNLKWIAPALNSSPKVLNVGQGFIVFNQSSTNTLNVSYQDGSLIKSIPPLFAFYFIANDNSTANGQIVQFPITLNLRTKSRGAVSGVPFLSPADLDTDSTNQAAVMTPIANNSLLSNITGATSLLAANTISQILDTVNNQQGSILYRNATGWVNLPPGTAGQVLQSNGAGQNVSWASAGSVSYTQFNWTPVSANDAIAFTASNGSGFRIGNKVTLWFGFKIASGTTSANYVQINGWPTTYNPVILQGVGTCTRNDGTQTANGKPFQVATLSDRLQILNFSNIVTWQYTANSSIIGTVTYLIG